MTEKQLQHLMDTYESLVWTVVSGVLKSRRDCEEAAADTFISLWNDDKFDPDAVGAKTYIIRVARRRAIDRIRSESREAADELPEDMGSADDLTDTAIRRENARLIGQVIRSLPPPDDEIFTRRYYYCQRESAIAKALGLRLGEVKRRLELTKTAVREKLLALNIIL